MTAPPLSATQLWSELSRVCHDLSFQSAVKATKASLEKEGYAVHQLASVTPELVAAMKAEITRCLNESIFQPHSLGSPLRLDDGQTFALLTDNKLRIQQFGEKHAGVVYHGAEYDPAKPDEIKKPNTRAPKLAQSNGMSQYFFGPVAQQFLSLPELYAMFAYLYNTPWLHMTPERTGVKGPGGVNQNEHLDAFCFPEYAKGEGMLVPGLGIQAHNWPVAEPAEPKQRIQAFLAVSGVVHQAKSAGHIQLIPYFHRYWRFLCKLHHPERGYSKWPKSESLPYDLTKKLDLNLANKFIEILHALKRGVPVDALTCEPDLKDWVRNNLNVAEIIQDPLLPETAQKLVWKCVQPPEGSIVLWDSTLPHHNTKNATSIPRMVAYIDFRPTYPIPESVTANLCAHLKDWKVLYQGRSKAIARNDLERSYLVTQDWYQLSVNDLYSACLGCELRTASPFDFAMLTTKMGHPIPWLNHDLQIRGFDGVHTDLPLPQKRKSASASQSTTGPSSSLSSSSPSRAHRAVRADSPDLDA